MQNTKLPLLVRAPRAGARFSPMNCCSCAGLRRGFPLAAFSLMSQHQPIFTQQQNQAALNIALRNAVVQCRWTS